MSAPEPLWRWAEQLLFGRLLADKLLPLEAWVDDPHPPLVGLCRPGRPPELEGVDRPPRQELPRSLLTEEARGRLLHAFANHELLAIELFALCLLRWPDAPSSFRRGVAAVLQDEQEHLRLYLARISELGVSAGEVPVNTFLWRTIADAPSPLDFVCRLDLVFEQANLDFMLHWAPRFAQAGDSTTSALLERVRRDEIRHVRHGWRWFERWRRPDRSPLEELEARLDLPLSTARARGPAFDRPGRQQAGLPDDFIDAIELCQQSKGRPPRVWWWNPGVEEEIARGGGPPAAAEALERQMGTLPIALARPGDVVLLRRLPEADWLRQVSAAGFALPEWVLLEEARRRLAGRRLEALCPWGWSPRAERLLGPLRPQAAEVGGGWSPGRRGAGDKAQLPTRRALLRQFLGEESAPCDLDGRRCAGLEDCETAVAELLPRTGRVVVKAGLSAAGRRSRRLDRPPDEADRAWLCRHLAEGPLLVEPWWPRRADLSFHWDLGEGQVRARGWNLFVADERGQFVEAAVGPWSGRLNPELRRLLFAGDRLERVGQALMAALLGPLREAGHEGPVGVDAMIYERDGALALHPLVEVNPRWTFGRLGLELGPRLLPGRSGRLRILRLDPAGRAWLAEQPPRCREGALEGGALPLSPPGEAQLCAVLVADARLSQGP